MPFQTRIPNLLGLGLAVGLGLAAPVLACDVDHHAVEKAETLAEAVALFNDGNARLATLMAQPDRDADRMEQVHRMT